MRMYNAPETTGDYRSMSQLYHWACFNDISQLARNIAIKKKLGIKHRARHILTTRLPTSLRHFFKIFDIFLSGITAGIRLLFHAYKADSTRIS